MVPDFSHLSVSLGCSLAFARPHENVVGFALALGVVKENAKARLLFLLPPLPSTEVTTLLLLGSRVILI